jgi:hypothetical protein
MGGTGEAVGVFTRKNLERLQGVGSRRRDEVRRRSAMRTTTRIWFGLGASALVLGASWAREPASWVPELARAAHAQASSDCPEGSTAPACVQGGKDGESDENGEEAGKGGGEGSKDGEDGKDDGGG